jgi:DNA-binding transcriptional MerR regulator
LTLELTPDCILGVDAANMNHTLKIGEASKATGLSIDAIRFYQRERLVRQTARTEGGFRLFSPGDIQTLRFIRQAQELGFSLGDIRQLLYLESEGETCSHVRDLLEQKLAAVRGKISELKKLERKLKLSLRKCNRELESKRECRGTHCPVLQELRQAVEKGVHER